MTMTASFVSYRRISARSGKCSGSKGGQVIEGVYAGGKAHAVVNRFNKRLNPEEAPMRAQRIVPRVEAKSNTASSPSQSNPTYLTTSQYV